MPLRGCPAVAISKMSGVINKLRKQNKTLAFFNVKTHRRLKKRRKKRSKLLYSNMRTKQSTIFWAEMSLNKKRTETVILLENGKIIWHMSTEIALATIKEIFHHWFDCFHVK